MRPLPHGPWGAELLRCAQQEVGFWSGILGACRSAAEDLCPFPPPGPVLTLSGWMAAPITGVVKAS